QSDNAILREASNTIRRVLTQNENVRLHKRGLLDLVRDGTPPPLGRYSQSPTNAVDRELSPNRVNSIPGMSLVGIFLEGTQIVVSARPSSEETAVPNIISLNLQPCEISNVVDPSNVGLTNSEVSCNWRVVEPELSAYTAEVINGAGCGIDSLLKDI